MTVTAMADVSAIPFQTGSAALVILGVTVLWLWTYRWQQRDRLEPKQWPIVGASFEIASHFYTMHDWLLSYFLKGLKTFRVVLPGIVNTYTVDPANVEYILKTNFSNFPKVDINSFQAWFRDFHEQ